MSEQFQRVGWAKLYKRAQTCANLVSVCEHGVGIERRTCSARRWVGLYLGKLWKWWAGGVVMSIWGLRLCV